MSKGRGQSVKIRIPVPRQAEKTILTAKDLEEQKGKKTSTQYIQEFFDDMAEEEDYCDTGASKFDDPYGDPNE